MLAPSRRELLKAAGLGATAHWAPAQTARAGPGASPYRHRGYLGWITDIATQPDPHAPWPSIRLDEPLLQDYFETFRLMAKLGYNEAVTWGLYVGRDWPSDIPRAISSERAQRVGRLIDAAHSHGLRVISGLGVFSWGFEQLIREFPSLSRTNPKAMCASNPDAWKWMEKITDFVFTRFPIDGVSMQSADLGRCNCSECSRYGDSEYHARINIREAGYIRSRYPGKTVAVSGWGMQFEDPASLPFMIEMGRRLDYLIDVDDSTRKKDPAYRRKVIERLPCAFGTIGGPLVEPPLHWARDRWFLPTAKAQGEHLQALAADGGHACEYFCHILANPGDEVSFWVAGKILKDPSTPWHTHLTSALEELYGVNRRSTVEALAELFVQAEIAYLRHIPQHRSGDISMEPLEGDHAGPAVYLTERLNAAQRAEYFADVQRLTAGFRKLAAEIPGRKRVETIVRCLENVQNDLKAAS